MYLIAFVDLQTDRWAIAGAAIIIALFAIGVVLLMLWSRRDNDP
jgi:hypothetical protein